MACLSAMQKCIRRGRELEAMRFAVELMHTSPAFATMVFNRLEVISHEDLDTTAAPWVVPFVHTASEQARALYKKKPGNPGAARMAVGNAIRLMCRSPKSREGDHFQAAVGLADLLEDFAPTIPDWANDQHTIAGHKLGRGLEHFRAESAKLLDPDGAEVPEDRYAEEAYRLWEQMKARPAGKAETVQSDAADRKTGADRKRAGKERDAPQNKGQTRGLFD